MLTTKEIHRIATFVARTSGQKMGFLSEDLIQDAFLAIWVALKRPIPERATPKTVAFYAARKAIAASATKLVNSPTYVTEENSTAVASHCTSKSAELKEMVERTLPGLLPKEHREKYMGIFLRRLSGEKFEKLGAMYGISKQRAAQIFTQCQELVLASQGQK